MKNLRWQICKRCIVEAEIDDTQGVYSINKGRLEQAYMKVINYEKKRVWFNPFSNLYMNYNVCKDCKYKMEHEVLGQGNAEKERNMS